MSLRPDRVVILQERARDKCLTHFKGKYLTEMQIRNVIWLILSVENQLSLLAIGEIYSRDHTTVADGIKKGRELWITYARHGYKS